jgi:hypothetical protein
MSTSVTMTTINDVDYNYATIRGHRIAGCFVSARGFANEGVVVLMDLDRPETIDGAFVTIDHANNNGGWVKWMDAKAVAQHCFAMFRDASAQECRPATEVTHVLYGQIIETGTNDDGSTYELISSALLV